MNNNFHMQFASPSTDLLGLCLLHWYLFLSMMKLKPVAFSKSKYVSVRMVAYPKLRFISKR